jgi:hypothetical protein
MGADLFNKIKEGISPVKQFNPENVEIYDDSVKDFDAINPNRVENPNLETISQNSQIRYTPENIIGTHFKNDLRNSITNLENLQDYHKENSYFPFYFKSINNNETCYFNAFFDNISENISAN